MKNIREKERKCIRYLTGEMSQQDQSIFEIELSLDDELLQLYDNYQLVWRQYKNDYDLPRSFQEKYLGKRNTIIASSLIVASLLFFISAIWFENTPSLQKITAEYGQRKVFYLPDSSKVVLNAGSTLLYPKTFNDLREVELVGEGYFEIRKDREHPFIVNNNGFKVKVLGTQFSIKNWSAKKEIFLKEGSVEFIQNNNKDKITLSPQERLVWDSASNQVRKEYFNPEKELAWINNILLLDNIVFRDALESINRFYGVKFVINSEVLLNQHITGSFKNQNLNDFIQSLEFIANVEIQELQDKIFLIKSNQYD